MSDVSKTNQLIEEARRSSDALRNAPFKIDRETFADGIDALADALEAATRVPVQGEREVTGNTSDGYHTFDELYEYRMLYNAHASHGWLAAGIPVVKSWKHSDGELCFGGGWFIVTATLPAGQVSNHYKAEHWGMFKVPEVELPPAYDGHTPKAAADRLRIEAEHARAVQGEPNDDREAREREVDEMILRGRRMDTTVPDAATEREALCNILIDSRESGEGLSALSKRIMAAGFSRAVVPDAATEKRSSAKIADLVYENASLKAERDAALAAVDRVRAVLSAWEMVQARNRECFESGNPGMIVPIDCTGGLRAALDGAPELDPYDDFCPTCDAPNPWHTETCAVPFRSVNSALDGAPEPEWEYGCADDLSGFLYDMPSKESAEANCLIDTIVTRPSGEELRYKRHVVRRRTAGPWLPVEGESNANH